MGTPARQIPPVDEESYTNARVGALLRWLRANGFADDVIAATPPTVEALESLAVSTPEARQRGERVLRQFKAQGITLEDGDEVLDEETTAAVFAWMRGEGPCPSNI